MKVVAVIILALLLLYLVRKNWLQVDLSFPLFAAITLLGLASTSEAFIDWLAESIGIIYKPLAVILIAIFILLALVTALAIAVSRLRHKQIMLVRHMASIELQHRNQIFQSSDKEYAAGKEETR
jgi:hypothetical protein